MLALCTRARCTGLALARNRCRQPCGPSPGPRGQRTFCPTKLVQVIRELRQRLQKDPIMRELAPWNRCSTVDDPVDKGIPRGWPLATNANPVNPGQVHRANPIATLSYYGRRSPFGLTSWA